MPKATKSKQPPSSQNKHQIRFLTLFDVDVYVNEPDSEEEYRLTYDVYISNLQELTDGLFGFTCHVAVGKKHTENEESFIQISAAYACSVFSEGGSLESIETVAKGYAGTIVWSQFTSLFGLLSHQMRIEFPPLPVTPSGVEIRQDEEASS
ncbi:hypothetical protein [Sinorhizobium sp. NFACC03]|uniref:hypothetical protein n=1 Tax=Sinorhizobium sp. NFACC03 TaxID=1566295 RepID=UPI000B866FB7|nr:hypothetical protein [Sinorhizobium sp. NFACC03]